MTIKLVAEQEDGKQYLIKTEDIGGANVVLRDVPCEQLVSIGNFVRMTDLGIAVRAIANSFENSNIMGCVESKSDLELCDIRVLGVSANIFSNLDVTKEYFLSDTVLGGVQELPPSTSGHVMLKIGQPYSSNSMLIIKGLRTVRI